MLEHRQLREEIIAACQEMVRLGLVVGTWGNISVRLPDDPTAFFITPSGMDYADLTPEDLVVVSLAGKVVAGHRKYSSETQLHRLVLKHRPDLNAVIHSHSRYASALCVAHKPLPPLVEDLVQIVGGGVDVTTYVSGRKHLELAQEVVRVLGGEKTAVFLANHGPVACGRSLTEAMITAQIVEKAAQMYLLAQLAGNVIEIPPEDVQGEREQFLYRYGQKEEEGR